MQKHKSTFSCLFAFLFLFLCAPALISQNLNEVIAKLKAELETKPDEKRKASIYSDLTWYYASISVDSAFKYGNKAIAASQKLNDSTLLSQIYSDMGAVHFRNNDFKNSEINYLKSYKIRKQQGNAAGLAKLNNNLASVYQSTFQFRKAMKMYLEALDYFEKTGDVKNYNYTKSNVGMMYTDLKDFDQAIKYISETLTYFESQEKTIDVQTKLCENYLNLGKAYQSKNDYAKAESSYNKSVAICGKIGNKQGFAFSKRNLATLALIQKKDSVAKINLEQSEQSRKEFNSNLDMASNDIETAQQLIVGGKYQEAKKKLLQIMRDFQKADSKENLFYTYKLLTNVYHHTNQNDSADYYFEKYISMNGELINTDVNRETADMEKKYQSLKKDNEIVVQKAKVFKRNVAVFSLLGMLLLGLVYYKNYQNKQKVRLQKEILHQQDLATAAVMNAEDSERKRMATHLHDGIGQLLTATNMNISVLNDFKEDSQAFEKVLDKIKNLLSEAISDVRTLSHQIMPNMLIKNSLAEALRDLIQKSTTPSLHIELKLNGLQENLNQNIQVVMYRIIQECINNTIKHANASKVEISVVQEGGFLEMQFRDNGVGFDTTKMSSRSDGLGLENIQSRIDMLKGTLQIVSAEGAGTFINMKIPV